MRRFFSIFAISTLVVSLLPTLDVTASDDVTIAAFSGARVGEVIVQYEGEDDFQVLHFFNNKKAALAMRDLQNREDVVRVQPNFIYEAAAVGNDPLIQSQEYLGPIHAFEGWDIANSSEEIVVAVIDTGVDIDHPDLSANIWVNEDEIPGNGIDDDENGFIDDVNGWDFVESESDPRPKFFDTDAENGVGLQHGTTVAGLIGAAGNNREGISGVTWNVKIMPIRVLNRFGSGSTENVTKGFKYALENGADVVNLSLVGTDYDGMFVDILEKGREENMVVVAAAGNSGRDLDRRATYPVCYKDFGKATVIGVGATDLDFKRTDFSNFGNTCIDVVAPGVEMFSTRVVRSHFRDSSLYDALFDGTSFSAPLVSGTVALMRSLRPSATPEQILESLQVGASSVASLNTDDSGFEFGLHVEGALTHLLANVDDSAPPPPTLPNNPEIFVFPQEAFGSVGYQYQLPGPIIQNQIFIDEELIEPGVNVFAEENGSLLLSNWSSDSRKLVRYYPSSGETELVFEIPEDSVQTIGHVAAGNVDFDQAREIVVVSSFNNKPYLTIYTEQGFVKAQFQPYPSAIDGGLDVDLWDINGDGIMEIVVAPVAQTAGQIRIFEYTGLVLRQWTSYNPPFEGGANISVADVNNDGIEELLVGPGITGGPHVKVFTYDGVLVDEFFAGQVVDGNGAKVEFFDIDNDFIPEYLISYKGEFLPVIRVYNQDGSFREELGVIDTKYRGEMSIIGF